MSGGNVRLRLPNPSSSRSSLAGNDGTCENKFGKCRFVPATLHGLGVRWSGIKANGNWQFSGPGIDLVSGMNGESNDP